MQDSHLFPGSSGTPLPERFLSRLVGFADLFTCPTWSNVLLLLAGAVLAPGRRTVSTALAPIYSPGSGERDQDKGGASLPFSLRRHSSSRLHLCPGGGH